MGKIAPSDWFFIDSVDEDDPSESFIVYACSERCRDGLWQRGPGKLDLAIAIPDDTKE